MSKPDFGDMKGQPRTRVVNGLYFDLKVIRNAIVDIEIDLRYTTKYEEIEEAHMKLEELYKQEGYILIKLVEEKKLIKSNNN